MPVTPVLSAMMCDGLGWFTDADYKRALLVYDEILYLLPATTLEFRDVTGAPMHLVHTSHVRDAKEFRAHSFSPDETMGQLLAAAARADSTDPAFASIVNGIPKDDRLYTWRAVNADGDLGGLRSIGLANEEQVLAHALLLNKFLLAAEEAKAVPITGKMYIHHLLGAKCRIASRAASSEFAELLPSALRHSTASYDAAIQQIVGSFVSDADLQRRSYGEILEFKRVNRALFERFSLLMRQTVERIASMPDSPHFQEEVTNLVNTTLWQEKADVEEHLGSAWHELFGAPAKNLMGSQVFRMGAAAATGGLVLGVLPCFQLGTLSLATLLAPGAVASTWMLERAFDYFNSHREAFKHGMYYLMRFSDAG